MGKSTPLEDKTGICKLLYNSLIKKVHLLVNVLCQMTQPFQGSLLWQSLLTVAAWTQCRYMWAENNAGDLFLLVNQHSNQFILLIIVNNNKLEFNQCKEYMLMKSNCFKISNVNLNSENKYYIVFCLFFLGT